MTMSILESFQRTVGEVDYHFFLPQVMRSKCVPLKMIFYFNYYTDIIIMFLWTTTMMVMVDNENVYTSVTEKVNSLYVSSTINMQKSYPVA